MRVFKGFLSRALHICSGNYLAQELVLLSRVSPPMQMTKSYFLPMKCQAGFKKFKKWPYTIKEFLYISL